MPYQRLLNQLQTAVVILDPALHIEYINAAAETLLDNSASRLYQVPFLSLFRFTSMNPQWLSLCLHEQQSVSDSEVVLELQNQHKITVELAAQPLHSEPWRHHILLELRQVDQIRRISQETAQQHQLHAVQALVRGLAHEIKNPLGGLRGAAQLLARELPTPALTEYTDLIMAQADRLRHLVDRLLGPNRIIERELTNIHAVLEQVYQMVRLEAPATVRLVRDYDPSIPELLMQADAIQQALLNIARNAIQAIAADGEVRFRTRVLHQETIYGKRIRQCLLVSIIDNGPGIDATIRDTLFYPMVTSRAEGTGLGLSIAQTMVQQHGGKIELSSEPGHTEFAIYLPYADATAGKAKSAEPN